MTKILQIDREAYARLEDYEPGSMGWRMITEPSGADCVGVAAFATHREQATRELADALLELLKSVQACDVNPSRANLSWRDKAEYEARSALTKATAQ